MARARVFWHYLLSLTLVAAITTFYRHVFHANPTTVALTFLLVILFVSAYWGFRLAAIAAVIATAAFNFFFLPPVGKFTIADPQNWIALFVFLVTAILASNLSERARREAAQANQRRHEVERLYALSESLLTLESTLELLNRLPLIVASIFQAEGALLRIATRDTTYRSRPDVPLDSGTLKTTIIRGERMIEPRAAYVPL